MTEESDEASAEEEEGTTGSSDFDGEVDVPEQKDSAEVGAAGAKLEEHTEPLMEGPTLETPVGSFPTRSLLSILVFVVVWCAVFFLLWGLIGGFGIVLGIILGTVLGMGAVKLMADRVTT